MTDTNLPVQPKNNVGSAFGADFDSNTLSFVLDDGSGFPQPINGSATSLGTAILLNSTGIQALGVEIGDIIINLTDSVPASNQWAFCTVVSVSTNSIVTTPLRGGSTNIWNASDAFCVRPFVCQFSKRTGDVITGAVTDFEDVLITNRSGNTLTIPQASGYRGFSGTAPQSFDTGDFCTIEAAQEPLLGILQFIARLDINKAEDSGVVHNTGNESIAGEKTFEEVTNFDVAPTSDVAASAPTELVRKQELDAAAGGTFDEAVFNVFQTGTPANTATKDLSALTAPRVTAHQDKDGTMAHLDDLIAAITDQLASIDTLAVEFSTASTSFVDVTTFQNDTNNSYSPFDLYTPTPASSRVVVKKKGKYKITISGQHKNGTGGGGFITDTGMGVNGTQQGATDSTTSASYVAFSEVFDDISLNANDYITIMTKANIGGAQVQTDAVITLELISLDESNNPS